jgi:hypothetical protein
MSQIALYEEANLEDTIEFDYGDTAYSRGYATAKGGIVFFPIIENGYADITVWQGRPQATEGFDKVVEGPLPLTNGELCIHEPQESQLTLSVSPGKYNVIFAQTYTDAEDSLEIDVFLCPAAP